MLYQCTLLTNYCELDEEANNVECEEEDIASNSATVGNADEKGQV